MSPAARPARQPGRWAFAIVLAAFMPHLATAGHQVDVRILDRTAAKPATHRARLLLDAKACSLDTTGLRGSPSTLLGRQGDAVYLLDHPNRRYVAINLQALSGASSVARNVGAMLPPALGDMLPASVSAGPCTVTATERRQQIAGLPCQLYVVTRDDQKIQELWVTPWSRVSMPRQSFDLIKEIAEHGSSLAAVLSAGTGAPPLPPLSGEALARIDGYPVLISLYDGGRPLYEVRLSAPKPATTTAADFAVPADYTRTLLPGS